MSYTNDVFHVCYVGIKGVVACFFFWVLCTLCLTSFTDPGILPRNSDKPFEHMDTSIQRLWNDKLITFRYATQISLSLLSLHIYSCTYLYLVVTLFTQASPLNHDIVYDLWTDGVKHVISIARLAHPTALCATTASLSSTTTVPSSVTASASAITLILCRFWPQSWVC